MDELAHINRQIADYERVLAGLRLLARQYDPESQHKTEHRPDQRRVAGVVCKCKEPAKLLQDYKGKGVDYYCCAQPKATGCDYWVRAVEVALQGR